MPSRRSCVFIGGQSIRICGVAWLADRYLISRANLAEAAVDPLLGQLLLHSVLRQARAQTGEVHVIHLLVLIEAPEHHRLLARYWIFVLLNALRATFLHH